jgi:hypothetical protein
METHHNGQCELEFTLPFRIKFSRVRHSVFLFFSDVHPGSTERVYDLESRAATELTLQPFFDHNKKNQFSYPWHFNHSLTTKKNHFHIGLPRFEIVSWNRLLTMKLSCVVAPLSMAFFASVGATKPTFISKASPSVIHQIPRGGAVDKTAVVKAGLSLVGVHAIVDLLAPTKSLDFYGLADTSKNPDPKITFVMLEIGAISMNYALIPALQIFQGLSFEKAAGWSCLPYIFMTVHKLLTNKYDEVSLAANPLTELRRSATFSIGNWPFWWMNLHLCPQIGMPKANGFFLLFIPTLTAYAAIQGLDFAPTMIKVYGLFSTINALVFFGSPKLACETWKCMHPISPGVLLSARAFGTVLATHAVACLTQAFYPETSVLDVVAYGAAVLGVTSLPVLKDFKDMGIEKSFQIYMLWVVLLLGTSYFLLN